MTETGQPNKPLCPICKEQPLDPQQREPSIYWCAICRKRFDRKLELIPNHRTFN
jgi:hypothetical protein